MFLKTQNSNKLGFILGLVVGLTILADNAIAQSARLSASLVSNGGTSKVMRVSMTYSPTNTVWKFISTANLSNAWAAPTNATNFVSGPGFKQFDVPVSANPAFVKPVRITNVSIT